MNRIILSVLLVVGFCDLFARDIYVGGSGASDNNPGSATQPYATIQKAASVAVAGDVIKIRSGTYRETIVPTNSGIVFQSDNGATVIINGNNQITTPWTVHSGNIYKTSVTLPVNGHQSRITSNTTLLANQIFKDGSMMFEARWPDIASEADLLNISKLRHVSQMVNFNDASLTDNSVPAGMTGAKLICYGWFWPTTRTVTSQSGSTLNYASIHGGNYRFRKYYYLTGKLSLLNQPKEWHYENGTLYLYQPNGGEPTGVEYKARNWGFDLRGKSNITINGIRFIGCEPVTTNENSANIVVDNIKAKYMNHAVMMDVNDFPGYGNAKQTGTKLIGQNNVIKNSELQYAASAGVWLGQGGRAENNLIQDIGYEGSWGAAVDIWGTTGNQVITKNTLSRTGRSCVDLGYNYIPGGVATNLNVEVSYNDMSKWGMLNIDLGAIYAWGFRNMTGSSIHHNWFHDAGVVPDPTGTPLDGIQTATYFDQASGPFTVHHNVYWNNFENLRQDAADHYTQPQFEHRNAGASLLYNNTFASAAPMSYVTYVVDPQDVQRNNIYRKDININWLKILGNTLNSLLPATDPQFNGTGQGGLAYRLKSSSPAINAGVIIPGITDGSVGAPDAGAYEYGGPDWIPGYTPQAVTTPTNTPPVGSITSPANNATFIQGTPISIAASASDANGTVTKVEFYSGSTKLGEDATTPYTFVWNNASAGTHSLTIKVTDNENSVVTSAAVSITVGTNTAPTVSITAPANNARVNSGVPITITATAADANGSVNKVEFFAGTTKLGEDLTSPYSFAWNNAAAGTHVLTAKATDNQNSVTTSTAVTLIVGTANAAPVVSITAPTNNAEFNSGAPITIAATATDTNGSISKVEFFNGATKLGEDLTSPYNFVWNNAPVGTYTLTAKATDNQSSVTTSSAIRITVINSNIAPVVSITSPANNAQFNSGIPITISANATDSNGSVTKVEFFSGATKLGEDLTSPYSFTWNNAAVGTHALTAKATDNASNTTTSAPVSVTVNSSNTPPRVAITSPVNNAQFTSNPITITASASDTNGSISKVEFFSGTTKLGEDLTSPYTFIWSDVVPGEYSLTAKATDNLNAVATSTPVIISFVSAVAPTAYAGEDIVLVLPNNSATLSAPEENPDGPSLQYNWQQLEGPSTVLFNSEQSEIILTNLAEGTYVFELTVTDAGGLTSSDQVNITVRASSTSAGPIPRVFTPNGDGKEDYWVWPVDERYDNSQLTILNQAGQVVYEASSYNNTWDGTLSGQPLQEGQYQYVIRLQDSTAIKASVRIKR